MRAGRRDKSILLKTRVTGMSPPSAASRRPGRRLRIGRFVDDDQREIGPLQFAPGAANPLELHPVLGLAQPRGVDNVQGQAVDRDVFANEVPGRAWHFRDDRRLVTGERVQQARFAGVRRSGDDDAEAVTQQAALARAGAEGREQSGQFVGARRQLGVTEEVDLLVRKVDGRLDIGTKINQALHDRVDPGREFAPHRVQRRPRRRRRATVDQVRNRLGLGEIDPVVQESTTGESPGSAWRAPAATTLSSTSPITTGPP